MNRDKFFNLEKKLSEVIQEGSELEFLDFTFSYFNHENNFGDEEDNLYEGFIDNFFDKYKERFRFHGKDEEAKYEALLDFVNKIECFSKEKYSEQSI